MPQDTRVNFPIETIEKTLVKQGNCCSKCGLPLTYGYVAHHSDGNNSNISEDNCQLLHPRCHESEQYATLKKQRESILTHIQNTLVTALSPQGLAGAALKEIAGLIDKEISMVNQVYGLEHFELPANQRIEYSQAVAQANLEAYQQGYLECLRQIPELIKGNVVKVKQ